MRKRSSVFFIQRSNKARIRARGIGEWRAELEAIDPGQTRTRAERRRLKAPVAFAAAHDQRKRRRRRAHPAIAMARRPIEREHLFFDRGAVAEVNVAVCAGRGCSAVQHDRGFDAGDILYAWMKREKLR